MKRDHKDILGGAALVGIGLFSAIYAQRYGIGTLRNVGPGFFPTVLGVSLAGIGLLIAISALGRSGDPPSFEWRTCGLILGSFATFAITLRPLGLLVASFLAVIVSSLADRKMSWVVRLTLAAVVSCLTVGIFVIGLNMSIPVFWGR